MPKEICGLQGRVAGFTPTPDPQRLRTSRRLPMFRMPITWASGRRRQAHPGSRFFLTARLLGNGGCIGRLTVLLRGSRSTMLPINGAESAWYAETCAHLGRSTWELRKPESSRCFAASRGLAHVGLKGHLVRSNQVPLMRKARDLCSARFAVTLRRSFLRLCVFSPRQPVPLNRRASLPDASSRTSTIYRVRSIAFLIFL